MAVVKNVWFTLVVGALALGSLKGVQAAPVTLANATAILSQTGPSLLVDQMIDGSINTNAGWGNNVQGDNTAVFETVTDLFSTTNPIPNGTATITGGTLTFQVHSGGFSTHEIGRFRLSATTADRSTFADGLANGGDVTTDWVVLTPLTFVSDNANTTLTLQGDNSLLASGPPAEFEMYTITVETTLTDITGFRFEAISDPSFVSGKPGRSANGNFVIQEFIVNAEASYVAPEPSSVLLLGVGALCLVRRRRRAA